LQHQSRQSQSVICAPLSSSDDRGQYGMCLPRVKDRKSGSISLVDKRKTKIICTNSKGPVTVAVSAGSKIWTARSSVVEVSDWSQLGSQGRFGQVIQVTRAAWLGDLSYNSDVATRIAADVGAIARLLGLLRLDHVNCAAGWLHRRSYEMFDRWIRPNLAKTLSKRSQNKKCWIPQGFPNLNVWELLSQTFFSGFIGISVTSVCPIQ
jgi:hypothetical protein